MRTIIVSNKQLITIAKQAGKLFSLPDICLQLQSLVKLASSNSDSIGRLIATDPALTARILKLANSAIYGSRSVVTSVPQAIMLLGTTEINNLAIATSAAQTFRTAGGGLVDMSKFWEKSILVGLLSKALAKKCKNCNSDGAFTAGLLHDIGKLLILEQLPDAGASAIQMPDELQPYWEWQKAVLGYTFAEAGGYLLDEWKLPPLITTAVKFQHQPLLTKTFKTETMLLHLSVLLSTQLLEPVDNHKMNYLDLINAHLLETTGIELDDAQLIAEQVISQVADIASLFSD